MLAMAASAVREADLDRARAAAFGLLTLLLLAMQGLFWRLEVLAARGSRPRGRAALALSLAAAALAFLALLALASVAPRATAFDILACIIFALFLGARE